MKFKKFFLTFFVCLLIGYIGTNIYYFLHKKYHEKRILVIMSSYKRPLLLTGQIIRLANQTYKNFDISISIKGAPKEWVEKTFMQEWQDLINSGKLRVRFDENKDQLANLLDPLRDIDISQYDFFCKIDDDDWYAPTYLEEVNEWLNKEDNIILSHSRKATLLRNGDNQVNMYFNSSDLSGPTMCFSRTLINVALQIEKNPAALEPNISAQYITQRKNRNEDALLHKISTMFGKNQHRDTSPYNIIYGQQYPSVIRGGGYLK